MQSQFIYAEIDRNPLFKGAAAVEDRSTMNATFLLNDDAHAETFDAGKRRYIWTSGHRSVGGYRAQCTMLAN
jgi:phosphoserine aminotransferase